jgi:hypothetical protein
MTPEQFNAWEANLIKTLKLNDEQKTTFMTLQNEMRMNFGQHPVQNPLSVEGGGWSPDEVTLSQDMTTLGLSVNVEPIRGVDQLRVLILSKDQAQSR